MFLVFTIIDHFNNDLQSSQIQFDTARSKAQLVINAIENLRSEAAFEDLWMDTKVLADKLDIDELAVMSRKNVHPVRSEQVHGAALEFSSPKEEYNATIFYKVIDHISGELHDRFGSDSHIILSQLYSILT